MIFPDNFPDDEHLREMFEAQNRHKNIGLSSFIIARKGDISHLLRPDRKRTTPDGWTYYSENSGICYGTLVHSQIIGDFFFDRSFRSENVYTFELAPEKRDQYLDWLANRSPWADAFLFKDNLYDNGIWWDVDQPGAVIFQAATLARYILEKPAIVTTWLDLVAEGFNDLEATLSAHYFKTSSTGKGLYKSNVTDVHTIFPYDIKRGYARAFLNNSRTEGLKPLREVNAMYPSKQMWTWDHGKDYNCRVAIELLNTERLATRWGTIEVASGKKEPTQRLRNWLKGIKNA